MTIQNVFDRLIPVERATVKLSRDTGYDPDDGLSGKVRHLLDMHEDVFIRDKAEEIIAFLYGIICESRYLQHPLHVEHTLMKLSNDLYGRLKRDRTSRKFTCGGLEAKIYDRCGNPCWVTPTVEHGRW